MNRRLRLAQTWCHPSCHSDKGVYIPAKMGSAMLKFCAQRMKIARPRLFGFHAAPIASGFFCFAQTCLFERQFWKQFGNDMLATKSHVHRKPKIIRTPARPTAHFQPPSCDLQVVAKGVQTPCFISPAIAVAVAVAADAIAGAAFAPSLTPPSLLRHHRHR